MALCFLYRFVRRRLRRRRRPQILVHAITFEQIFGFLSFLARLLALTCRIPWLDFGRFSSWAWPIIFKVKYGICYITAKNSPIATKRKANISIELLGSNVTIGFDLGHDLDLEFSRSNIKFAISQPKLVPLPRNEHITYRLNSGAQMWPSGLTWPWPWPLIFKVNYGISYISAKNVPIATKRKANVSIELQGLKCNQWVWPWLWPWFWRSNVTLTFDHTHDLDDFHGQILK